MTHDALGRVLTRTSAAGGEQFGYCAAGLSAYTNQLSLTNGYVYDKAGRKTAETNANGESILYGYDPSGNLTNLVDGNGHNTSWNYDFYSRLTNKVDHAGTVMLKYAYDLNHRLTNRWSAAKGTTVYGYDGAGNLTSVSYPANHAITLTYDALSRLTNMVDGVGTTIYAYDAAGQVLSEDGPWVDDTVSFVDSNRLRTGLSVLAPDASAWTQSYGYDAARRLTNVVSPAGAFGYSYAAGQAASAGSLVQKLAAETEWCDN